MEEDLGRIAKFDLFICGVKYVVTLDELEWRVLPWQSIPAAKKKA